MAFPNPLDPRNRSDLSKRQKIALKVTDEVVHGANYDLIDVLFAPDYRQHTAGIGQGREGLRRFVQNVASRRSGSSIWQPVMIFEDGDFVILYKLLSTVMIVDILRFNERDELSEHWDVVQPLPHPEYDPLEPSTEDFSRFYEMYGIVAAPEENG